MNQEFFYVPPSPRILKTRGGREVSTAEAKIYLADIPFVRLRGSRDEWSDVKEHPRRYSEIVERAQLDLDFLESDYEVEIDMENYCVTVKDRVVPLAPREMFFYAMFAGFRLAGRNGKGVVSLNELTKADFNRTYRAITRARDNEDEIDNCEFDPKFVFLKKMLEQIAGDETERNKFKQAFHVTVSRIGSSFDGARLPERYTIALNKDEGQSCYWLPLKPGLIRFIKTSPLE